MKSLRISSVFRSIWHSVRNSARQPLVWLLAGLSVFNCLLLFIRIRYSGYITFLFLAWNLVLAWVPFLISLWLKKRRRFKPWLVWSWLLVWLLFFPNAPYLLTDLVHLKPRIGVPFWFDSVLLISFGINGLILGLFSLQDVQLVVKRLTNRWVSWLAVVVSLVLGSFGVYLGRVLRWNSWDALFQPRAVGADILERLLYPLWHWETYFLTLGLAAFLGVCYLCSGWWRGEESMKMGH